MIIDYQFNMHLEMVLIQWLARYNETKSIKQYFFLSFYSKHLLFIQALHMIVSLYSC